MRLPSRTPSKGKNPHFNRTINEVEEEMHTWLRALLVVGAGAAPLQLHGQSPQFRGTPELTGVVETFGAENFGGVAWRFETGSTVRSSPALVDGILFVGSSDGYLYALDAESGQPLWKYDAGSPIASSPSVAGGIVLVGSRDGVLHGLSASEGTPQWRLETGPDLPLAWGYEGWDYIMGSATVAGGVAFWGSGDGHVHALDPQTGTERWSFDTGGRIRSTPAVSDGLLVIGNSDGFVFALDAESGDERWRFETAGASMNSADFGFDRVQLSASPAISEGIVYIGSRDASLYALDARDGSVVWTFEEGGTSWIITTAAVTADRVISARSGSGNIRAIDRATGTEVWNFQAGAYVYSSPVVVGNTIYIGQGDGDFSALDVDSGEERWNYRTGAAVYSTPVVHNGRVYVGSDDGFVYAFSAAQDLPLERAVFFDEDHRLAATFGQPDSHLGARDYFVNRGYTLLDASTLETFMQARIADGGPSVVVFAMDVIPEAVGTAPTDEGSLFRRYLDAGGKVVWMGYPPGYLIRDMETGAIQGVDRSAPTSVTGVDFDAYLGDSYGVTPTITGRRWGLSNRWVGGGSTLPAEVSEVLATDELGRAAAWVKNYGGAPGTGFVFLFATVSHDELAAIQRVAEYSSFAGEGGRR
jgi:outer membrane protein assembly factor BamB